MNNKTNHKAMKIGRKLLLIFVWLGVTVSAAAVDFIPAKEVEMKFYQVDTLSGRIYYVKPIKYTLGDVFGALDIPTNFGVGFIPDKNTAERFAYYSAMFLEYRYYKTFGWYFQAGLDSHDHDYKNYPMTDPDGKANVLSGTVFNMQLVAGGGYRIPLVRDIKAYYEHPYVNRWNLSTLLQIGGAWSRIKEVIPDKNNPELYHLENDHHFYPVLKAGVAVECFTSASFSVFLSANYMQHLMRQPWDTPNMTGTLSFGVGFAGFFN